MKRKMKKLSLTLAMSAFLGGCGGTTTGSITGGGTSGGDQGATGTGGTGGRVSGLFLDAAVENLHYDSLSNSGNTDASGRFTCKLGEEVAFSIGNLLLGTSTCQRIVTPQTIAATIERKVVPITTTSPSGVVTTTGSKTVSTVRPALPDDPVVVNRIRLLLTLDTDSNPDNGIQLPPLSEQRKVVLGSLDFSNAGNSFDNAATTDVIEKMPSVANRSLADERTARAHFSRTLSSMSSVSETPDGGSSGKPVNIGAYYDKNTGGFDERALEAQHREFGHSAEGVPSGQGSSQGSNEENNQNENRETEEGDDRG